MSRASVLARGRAFAEAGMTDTCTIARVTGTTTNPTTGVVTPTTTEIYSGACRIQELLAFSRDTAPTPPDPELMRYRILQLPVDASEDVREGDNVTIVTCLNDPDLVGVAMRVRDQSGKSEATTRRIGIEEST